MRTGSVLLFVGLLGYAVACGGEELVGGQMAFPIRVCSICSEEFELRPEKPGFANRCPTCSEEDEAAANRIDKA